MADSAGPDERHLDGLDPYDILDREAARIEAWLGGVAVDDPLWDQHADLVVDDGTLVAALNGRLGDDADPAVQAALSGH